MKDFKAGLVLAVIVSVLVVMAYAQTLGPDSVDGLNVTHIYEDGCMDVYDRKTGVYNFVCPSEF